MSIKRIELKRQTENTKANIWFLTSTLYSLLLIITSFFLSKFTISIFGEATSGVNRFFSQITTYVNVLNGGIFLIFSIKVVNYYKNNEIDKIRLLSNWLSKITKISSIFFFFILLLVCLIPSFLFSNTSLTFSFIYFLTFSIGLNLLFTILFISRKSVFLTSTNNGFILSGASIISRVISFSFFIFIIFLRPPQLQYFLVDGVKILDFSNGTPLKAYSLVLAYIILALDPVIASLIINRTTRKNIFFTKLTSEITISDKEKKEMKKTIYEGLKNSFLLNLVLLFVYNTDEFALLMLKSQENTKRVLQIITIFGLYSSMSLSLRGILTGYIESKNILISNIENNDHDHQKFMNELRTTTHLLSSIFLVTTIFFLPFLAKVFFQPANSINYADFKLSIPFAIFNWTIIFNTVIKQELIFSNKLRTITIFYLLEGCLNLLLTFGFVLELGVYWVIWASVIASCTKILFFEIYILLGKKHKSQFRININKKSFLSLFLYMLSIVQIINIYLFDLNSVISGFDNNLSIVIFAFIILFDFIFTFLLIFNMEKISFLLNFNSRKKIQEN